MIEQDSGSVFIETPYEDDAASRNPPTAPLAAMRLRKPDPLAAKALTLAGVSPEETAAASAAARANRTDLASELVAGFHLDEDRLADAMAAALRLPRGLVPRDTKLIEIEGHGRGRVLRTTSARPQVFVAPRLEDLPCVDAFLATHPHLAKRVRIATPGELGEARAAASAPERSERARLSLSRDEPRLSARDTMTGWQGFAAALLLMGVIAALLAPTEVPILRLLVLSVYLACIGLRFAAAIHVSRAPVVATTIAAATPATVLPRYSVLVALRDEKADTIATLVASLQALRWPRSKLEIFLVCEADDRATVAEVRRATRGLAGFRVVETPPSHPRTKPKALNFALPLATGAFVLLFDAEDRPHPDQLLAAWRAFEAGGERLACVQAPLVVTNGHRTWLGAQFALEYAALFHGLLPYLARKGMPLPLGGTSNHFRHDALLAVGGWDSHNVAEDADLGIRLARHGYRTGVIDAPTREAAPERWIDWRNQRTRWMKGWMQTWLVHMRDPRRLLRELGLRDFVAFQLLFGGMILSSAMNTLLLAVLLATALSVASGAVPSASVGALLALDLATLVLGFAVQAALVTAVCRRRPTHRPLLRHLWTLPTYWLLISIATLRAMRHLAIKPQLWEKTPHGRQAGIEPAPDTAPAMLPASAF